MVGLTSLQVQSFGRFNIGVNACNTSMYQYVAHVDGTDDDDDDDDNDVDDDDDGDCVVLALLGQVAANWATRQQRTHGQAGIRH